jgi:hypothetical protein
VAKSFGVSGKVSSMLWKRDSTFSVDESLNKIGMCSQFWFGTLFLDLPPLSLPLLNGLWPLPWTPRAMARRNQMERSRWMASTPPSLSLSLSLHNRLDGIECVPRGHGHCWYRRDAVPPSYCGVAWSQWDLVAEIVQLLSRRYQG